MGRIPTIAVIAIGVILILGASALMYFMVLKPAQEQLAQVTDQYNKRKEVADRLPQAQAKLEQVEAEWLAMKEQEQALRETRSIPISFAHPAAAMIALWYEYREDLPPLIEQWVESTGCTIESGASFPAPPMTPPSPPPSGFLQVPAGQTITLTVSGTLTALERLYRSLDQFPRVVTLRNLVMQAADESGEILQAQIPFTFYLLVEAPPTAAAAAPAAAAPGMGMPGMPGAPGMPGEPGMPPEPGMAPEGGPPGGAPPAAPEAPAGGGGGEDLDV
ncbi:MAG: hypothetical protein AB7Y46_02030 [Armatimonadota bacterium]